MGPAHFGVAFAVRPLAPKVPLWALLVAGQVLDLLCFGFIAIGIENMGANQSSLVNGIQILSTPSLAWSHGLFMSLVWSALAAGVSFFAFRDLRVSAVIGMLVFSHWLLDFIVHPRYLPLFFTGSPTLGLGLWGSGLGLIASAILDVGLLIGGVAVYWVWKRNK